MEFPEPVASGFTVYGKSGCSYCTKVKALLTEYEQEFTYVNCDEFLVEKEAFLAFIQGIAEKEHKTFPIIFRSKAFIGGYMDTLEFLRNTIECLDK